MPTTYHRDYYMQNRETILEKQRLYRQRNIERYHAYDRERWPMRTVKRFLKRFGLTHEIRTGEKCWICGDPGQKEKLVIDHDHSKKGIESIRGILCRRCNLAIGNMRDDPKLLLRAAEYLTTKLPLRVI
jgi:5-methylcytosine-specific restriction endonuclease McrA